MTNETMKIWAHNHIYGKTYSELLHETYSINQLAKKGLYPLYEYERVFDCIRSTISDRMKELRNELEDLKGLEEFVESDYHEYCSNDDEDDEVILSEYELTDDEDDEVILVHECNEDDEKPYLWDITEVNRYEREHVGGITKMNK